MSDLTDPATDDQERAIILAAQNGDESAHAAIYAQYSRRLYTLIYRLVPRRAQAEDLLQEVFVEVLRSISDYRAAGSFGGWLRSIAVNKTLAYLRSPWQRGLLWMEDAPEQLADTQAPLDLISNAQHDLERALKQLSALSRAVVWLHDVEGYTHGEIAAAMGRTVSFSKSQLARAHERLRELLNVPTETLSCTPVPSSLSISS